MYLEILVDGMANKVAVGDDQAHFFLHGNEILSSFEVLRADATELRAEIGHGLLRLHISEGNSC